MDGIDFIDLECGVAVAFAGHRLAIGLRGEHGVDAGDDLAAADLHANLVAGGAGQAEGGVIEGEELVFAIGGNLYGPVVDAFCAGRDEGDGVAIRVDQVSDLGHAVSRDDGS